MQKEIVDYILYLHPVLRVYRVVKMVIKVLVVEPAKNRHWLTHLSVTLCRVQRKILLQIFL